MSLLLLLFNKALSNFCSLTARVRKSALKARKGMQHGSTSSDPATLEIVDKSLRLVKRHRKQRHARLRDVTREDDELVGLSALGSGRGRWARTSAGTLCPVCMKSVPGDMKMVETHVDACLAHEARMQDERDRAARALLRQEEYLDDVDVDGDVRILATDGASLRGKFATATQGAVNDTPRRTRICRSRSQTARRG